MDILIVSGDEKAVTSLSSLLADTQLELGLASNNTLALELIERKRPWLVFSDIDGDDIDILALLKPLEKSNHEISLIALADSFDAEQAISLMRRGLRDYFAQPFVDQQRLIEKAIFRAKQRAKGILEYMSEHDSFEQERDDVSRRLNQLREDQEAGRYVQMKLLPKTPLRLGSFEFSHRIYPSLYLSGDFMDYFALDEYQHFFYFADVSGHGSSSAFVTTLLKTISHRWVIFNRDESAFSPSSYIEYINKEMLNMNLGKHMTLFCGVIDEREMTLTYSVAAHFPKPYLKNGGGMSVLQESALPVGVFEQASYPENQINLSKDSVLYLFSDGILETMEAESLDLKEAKLFEVLEQIDGDIEGVCGAFDLEESEGERELVDDIGMLIVRHVRP